MNVRCVRVGHAGCFPVPDTRAVICKAASCAGVRAAEPPAHESPPSPRWIVRRPGSLNITASCVRVGGCAVTLTAPPFPRRPRNRPLRCSQRASLPASVPPAARLAQRKKLARESNLAQWNVAAASDKKSVNESAVAGKVNAQPLEVAPVVRRWFVRSSPRARSWIGGHRKRLLLWWCCWLGEVASEPLGLRVAGGRRGPAYWALWLPRRAA